jgi:predicted dehydrogenase
MNKDFRIILVGAGPMAIEYAKVLKQLSISFITIGNTKNGALNFERIINEEVVLGGIENWIFNNSFLDFSFYKIIVAVNEDLLGKISLFLLNSGFINLLVEKPGGLNFDDIQKLNILAKEKAAKVYIAYNRRFLTSILTVQERIKQDGGLISFNFEFTEWGHIVKDLKKNDGVLSEWFFQNSSHVIDLAFFIGGAPKQLNSFVGGGQSWHPKGTIFSGAGISNKNALFSYNANWESSGRWFVEFLSAENRYILKPLEQLFVQKRGSTVIEQIDLQDDLDKMFKPGLYRQLEALINSPEKLMTVEEQNEMLFYYKCILEGKNY